MAGRIERPHLVLAHHVQEAEDTGRVCENRGALSVPHLAADKACSLQPDLP